MPIMSQMIFSGSGAAISVTKSHAPLSITRSMISLAARRTSSSACRMRRGVKPRDTIRRRRA
jgi:hypothetical protein